MSDFRPIGIEALRGEVKPEWIDVNNHMNVAYYVLAFDYAVDAMWERYGITEQFIAAKQQSTFAVESHISWVREMKLGDPYLITTQILAYDDKRIHQFMRMFHARDHYLAATAEWLNLFVDLSGPKVVPWPDTILGEIDATARGQTDRNWPVAAGRRMQIAKPVFRIDEGSA